ncbi:MAG: tRNA (adenosine(37)-N6)-dimethylallyltransferase MiaA [Candidatus Bipolaricaulota bacterium]|nr:tRNA (adenosine(37)-N6)-dimethylallyltransferase MiaA [Candidatus Bipolaricaulota bacterium]MDW8126867.1 tRNA (adenosine(37)-N6)-dimethylallyltransferase MiaA [Candidatus Bipolaricaulota bacterium]
MTVLLLFGPTAVGKTRVAADVAEKVGAEVISADARTIFRELVVGADRPPPEILARVPHHLVGVLLPDARYDAAQFRADCERLVAEIHARGKRVVIVGGSTLYVRALTRGLFPGPARDKKLRAELARLPTHVLREELVRVDPRSAEKIHPRDRVRMIRALEVFRLTGKPISMQWGQEKPFPWPLVKVGLICARAELYRRIEARVERMFKGGLVEEARRLWEMNLPEDAPILRTIGYRELFGYFRGEYDLAEAKRRIIRNTKDYARRQLAFFRAEEDVVWLDVTGKTTEQVVEEVLRVWRAHDPSLK